MTGVRRRAFWAVGLLALGCAGTVADRPGLLPPPPAVFDSLQLRVVYPRLDDTSAVPRALFGIASRDSAFVFGSTGRGDAMLTVNGHLVPVHPNGAWIAWIPLPDDSVARFNLVARAGADTSAMTFEAALPARFDAPSRGAWIDTTSFAPRGDRWVRPQERVRLAVRAAPDATVRLVLPDSTSVALVRNAELDPPALGELAFGTTGDASARRVGDRYSLGWTGALGPDPGAVLGVPVAADAEDSTWAVVEAVVGTDTARARWPLRLAVLSHANQPVAVVNDDTAGTGETDSILAGRPTPNGTYHWFFPTGTRALVSGRWNDQVRLQLSTRSVAWVDAEHVRPLPPGTPAPGVDRTARSLRLFPDSHAVALRIPLAERVPFRVDETERSVRITLYGVAADMDWIQYGGTDPLVTGIQFDQPTEDETVVTVHLASPVWGYRTRWRPADLLLEVRRPPEIDRRAPFRGLTVALDAGHPPGGATGPTGVYEAAVTLAVAQKAATLLEAQGARVQMIRRTDEPLGLLERVIAADREDAHLLVSIHANALPDGVNPFVNNGTSVYYYHRRSIPLAIALDRSLARQFGFRDLGIGRGDLALARPTWMPAALTEGLFMMIPEQEAVLASEEGQWRYARGIVDGLLTFLADRRSSP